MPPEITRIECIEFSYEVEDLGMPETEYGGLYGSIYKEGSVIEPHAFAIRVETDIGITGMHASRATAALGEIDKFADVLIGKNPLDRERHWTEIRRELRSRGQIGIGPVDIALWDFAGKYRDAPIHELLGTYREKIPAYASTNHAGKVGRGGLDSPEAYADFAEECLDLGYPAFKMHGFDETNPGQEFYEMDIEAVNAVGERVGDEMDLMLDASCRYGTFGQAVEVGKACDENDFFWYEDPYSDMGTSQHGHRKLRELIDTPLLQAEMIRGVEPHADFIAADATDFVRADPDLDGGITGAMKISRIAEGFGLDVEYHSPGPAQRHCLAAIRNTNYYEMSLVLPEGGNPVPLPIYDDSYEDGLEAIDDDGTVPVPDGPGLGVSIDWSGVGDRETDRHVYE